MVSTFVDFSIITKQYVDKWNTKYKVRSSKKTVPRDLIERDVSIGEFSLIWNLSSSRFVNFQWTNVRSVNEYFQSEDSNTLVKDVIKEEEALLAISRMDRLLREKKFAR